MFLMGFPCAWADELSAAIANARTSCGTIGAELNHMKTMAGINTAVTGVGTVAGGVALGTGLAKKSVDKKADVIESELQAEIDKLNQLATTQNHIDKIPYFTPDSDRYSDDVSQKNITDKQAELDALTNKSKALGNWRTGTLAGATATNIAGAVIAGTNRVRGDLKSQIDECLKSLKTLSAVRMQARIDNSATDAELARAENIVRTCENWATVDVSSINNKSTGATVSAGVGAGLGLAGTITSASANSQTVREGDANKEKNLNTAANVLAGGTTVASGVATVFNATQISAIKRAAAVADECERALQE